MERLTEWKDDRKLLAKTKFSGDFGSANVLGRLAKYEDLEEQGLLLRLPTEAYFIKDNIVCKGWVQELVYSPCRKLLLDIRYDDNSLDSYRGYVGNTVFLTKAEAEQKLKEMESD